jgi:hypothetical protein
VAFCWRHHTGRGVSFTEKLIPPQCLPRTREGEN